MLNKNPNILVNKAKKLKIAPKLDIEEIFLVEKNLGTVFPDDFKKISSMYDYEYIGTFEMYSFPEGVVEVVKSWRESIALPYNCIVLGEDGTSAIIMKIEGYKSTVIWCSMEDVLNLCEGKPMEYNPTIFPSFTDFFEFLIEEEEKMQAEEKELVK